MFKLRTLEVLVGVFMLIGLIALFVLAFKVSSLSQFYGGDVYMVSADFDNIGSLKTRAPVSIAGVRVGEVVNIDLNPETFQAHVSMKLLSKQDKIPVDSSASILTQGLLGSNYVNIRPGYAEADGEAFLKDGSHIEETYSALILEDLVGKFVFNIDK